MSIGSHTIPRFYLEQFANPAKRKSKPGKVWTYEKGKPAHPRSTDSQGYENGYFAFVRPDGTKDESFENRLAELEARCNDALVCAKSQLYELNSLAHKNMIAFYIGLLFARSTSRRKFAAGTWIKMQEPFAKLEFNNEYVEDTADRFSELTGQVITPEQIREMIRKQVASFPSKEMNDNTFIQNLLFHAETLKADLVPRPWQVLQASAGAEFVTSDNPVVTFLKLREDLWHPGHGFRKPGVIVAFPLAPAACLTIGFGGREFQEVDAATVKRMNEVVISSCDRFIYSKTRNQEITDTVNTIGGWSVPGKTAFLGEMPGTNEIEEYLRQTMRIERRKSKTAGST